MSMSGAIQSPFGSVLAGQLEALFASGGVEGFVYRRTGVAGVSFTGVVDAFPARLLGNQR